LAVAQRCSGIAGSTGLFSALLNYRHSTVGVQEPWTDATGVRVLAGRGRTNYPVVLSVDDAGEGFGLEMETDHRIDPQRMLGFVRTALQSLVQALEEAPQRAALMLPVLPEAERRQVIELFNVGREVYGQGELIHELFERQAERTPDATAVVYEDQSLSYGELNRRANQLARHLRSRGVGPDQLVGICLERGLEMVIGLLGILKAGGGYLPLDPAYPLERLAYMLADAAPKVLLTQERLRQQLPRTGAEVVRLDADWASVARQDTQNLDGRCLGLHSRHLAYVIYTSGSTGQPKGVMVEHGNLTRLFAATQEWFHFNERDVWTLFHSFAFDFSVWELWGALLHGGRVIVVPHLMTRSPQEFYRLVCEQGVTVLNQTPSAFAQLIDAQAESADLRQGLRVVIFGGEALELRTLRPWVRRNSAEKPQLVNMYGITETTVHVTYRPLSQEEIEWAGDSPIGRAIPDLRTYLLDRNRQPVAVGVVGEIYVAGAGVARGYLNRPELTAERFLQDPFSADLPTGDSLAGRSVAQARMYKSGDLGRWQADGTMEYLGRNDHQVKVRGFRIELGEIEARLLGHRQVKEATVLAREEVGGEKRLVAYVVPEVAEAAPSVATLRAHLLAVLPEYMVPSAFVMLERFPLTLNGKLDRKALPAPELEAYLSRQYEAPQGEVEEILAGIWQELLGVERVGRHDNFFELGGHSLLSLALIREIAEAFALDLSPATVFRYPTIVQLSAVLESLQAERRLKSERMEFQELIL
jgi:amino acid adenylation domain-containing protein